MNTCKVPKPILNAPFTVPENSHLEIRFLRAEGYTPGYSASGDSGS